MINERGSNATMYYTTMYKNGKMYNLEVLYDEISNTVYHFEYARKVMQIPLQRIADSASNGSVFPVVTEHFSASSDHAFL